MLQIHKMQVRNMGTAPCVSVLTCPFRLSAPLSSMSTLPIALNGLAATAEAYSPNLQALSSLNIGILSFSIFPHAPHSQMCFFINI